MSRIVAIGLQSFSDIREGNYFYVDKMTKNIFSYFDTGTKEPNDFIMALC